MLNLFQSILRDPPPGMAFEISEEGIAAARIGSKVELEFCPLRTGVLSVSPVRENVVEEGEFSAAVKKAAALQASWKRKGVALVLPDYSARLTVVDFDQFPSDAKEQLALIRFRLKRSVPFDVDAAAISFVAQPGAKNTDVVVVMTPAEIVTRYEAPFRAAGMHPGLVTMSSLAALELAPGAGLNVFAKLAGRVLTVLVRNKSVLKMARCVELPSAALEEAAAVLAPTFVYVEDNLGGRAERLTLCGFGAATDEVQQRFSEEFGVEAEPLRSPLGTPGENNAGLLGYLRSVARNN